MASFMCQVLGESLGAPVQKQMCPGLFKAQDQNAHLLLLVTRTSMYMTWPRPLPHLFIPCWDFFWLVLLIYYSN